MVGSTLKREADWPQRTWILTILAALFALAMQQLIVIAEQQLNALADHSSAWDLRLMLSATIFLGTGGLAFGLTWMQGRLVAAIAIALVCALLSSSVVLWSGTPYDFIHGSDGWHLFCGLVTSGFVLILFQAAQDRDAALPVRWSPAALRVWQAKAIHYVDVHGHLWTNVLLIGLAGLFAGLTMGLAFLMAAMFSLVKLDFLHEALRQYWFDALLLGAAFGAALGLLRDHSAFVTLLQRVGLIVLRVLAPMLAIGIFVFLAALPFTGLEPLWQTGETTPVMLVGAMLALLLANAVVGDAPAEESRSSILRSSAAALGLFLVPMVGIAAFSSGLRIRQYGLSPDRLWALTFIIVAGLTAVAYAIVILQARGWFARLRWTNLQLVYLIGVITLLLSTPLLGFERIATGHQLSRLAGGQVSAEEFDYRGMWFHFGPSGRAAIEELAMNSPDATIRRFANEVQDLRNDREIAPSAYAALTGGKLDRRLTVLPRPVPLDPNLREQLVMPYACDNVGVCTLHYVPGQDFAVVIREPAAGCFDCQAQISMLLLVEGEWSFLEFLQGEVAVAAIKAGQVEMRPVRQRQLFIGGRPYGQTLPPKVAP